MSLFKGVKIFDAVSSAYKGLTFYSEVPKISAQDYCDTIARGVVTNHATWNKIGFRDASTSGVEVAVSPQLSATVDLKVTCATNDTGAVLTCGLRGWTE
jgi:hypothetical protein